MIRQSLEGEGLPSYEYCFKENTAIFQVFNNGRKEYEGVCSYYKYADDDKKMMALEQDMKFLTSINPSHYSIIAKKFLEDFKSR